MTILTVGAGQSYSTIAAAVAASHDGDTVQVQAGTYVNDFATINTRILIQGVGGMVNLLATVPPPDGKAYFTSNTDVSLDHLAFSGVQVADQNGAGIRYQGGNLTVTNCYFHDNQDGILGTPGIAGTGTVTIKNSEFAHNGAGDGYSHNIYIGDIASLVIDNSYFHDAVVGHEIKSRAEQTTITNSRIQDGPTGTASYGIDLPNGGKAVIENNTIEKGPNAGNPAIIAYGEEGNLRLNSSLTVTGNTILNYLGSPSAVAVWNAAGAPANVTGNATHGLSAGQIIRGAAAVPGNTTLAAEPALNTSSPWAGSSTLTSTGSAAQVPPTPVPIPTPPPAPNPTPMPTPPVVPAAPAAITIGSGPDTLALQVSEDAWQGDAQYTVSIDGRQIGGTQTATASHGAGQAQAVNVLGSFSAGSHTATVNFLNDAYAGTSATDRNLYVAGATIDGTAVPNTGLTLLSGGPQSFSFNGAVSAAPPPAAADTLDLHVSEDAWQGDAQYTVQVDGNLVGGVRTATALHGQGATQAVSIGGAWGAGPHTVGITFINDAYGGTAATDRNLYVDAVTYDGRAASGAPAALMSGGTASFGVAGPAVATSLTLHLAEDAWQGDAQYAVAIDGATVVGQGTVVALNGSGRSQAVNLSALLSAGKHDVAVSFLNDAYGGTSSTDRNLYVKGIDVNSAPAAGASATLYSSGTSHLQIVVPSS